MGLAQTIKFKFIREELENLISSLDFAKIENDYFKKTIPGMEIEIRIIEDGIYIHRSGQYFEDLGKLVEGLGKITEVITIEDYP